MTASPVRLELALDHGRTAFEPGARIAGTASWSSPRPVWGAELRLSWSTRGKGGRDLKIVDSIRLPEPRPSERRTFILTLPTSPWSFTGALVSLIWMLELVVSPGDETAGLEIVMAPERTPVDVRLPVA